MGTIRFLLESSRASNGPSKTGLPTSAVASLCVAWHQWQSAKTRSLEKAHSQTTANSSSGVSPNCQQVVDNMTDDNTLTTRKGGSP
eukprot:5331660-Amphidinium_carterae.1